MSITPRRYKPIGDYGAIGNLRTVALAGIDGAIDWCCFPHMNDASVFAAILDRDSGGTFRVSPRGIERGRQRYLEGTNVLETRFDLETGRLTVTDFFPLAGDIEGRNGSHAPPEIRRVLQYEGAETEVDVLWEPRFDYGRADTRIDRVPGGFEAYDRDGRRLSLNDIDGALQIEDAEVGPHVRGRLRLNSAATHALVTRWGRLEPAGVDESLRLLDETCVAWRRWAYKGTASGDRGWAGPWHDEVLRSELVLKMLTHADTGAIAAAPTTSLPETVGGVRNWDYRYCWIRDAGMTAQAFLAMGHEREMVDFVEWAERVSRQHAEKRRGLQIMYGLHGEDELPLQELEHMEGYLRSTPVHVGNEAVKQDQPDVLGELLDAALQIVRRGHQLPDDIREFLPALADEACEAWLRPDNGLWEQPLEPKHYVYSKALIWVALDRALALAERDLIEGDAVRWRACREQVRRLILEAGVDGNGGTSFVQTLGGTDADASSLVFPMEGVVPFDDPRVQGTIDRTLRDLTRNDLVYRYRNEDGLPGEEGAFVICTTWLVDALALTGRVEEAQRIFAHLVERANHLGLFAEQLDPYTGAHLGNFPQAFSHIGVINSAVYLAEAEGRNPPELQPPL
jgi:GH15 family glucan-1,4-alpha-glucosidase